MKSNALDFKQNLKSYLRDFSRSDVNELLIIKKLKH